VRESSTAIPWTERLTQIADGWLLSDVEGTLPAHVVIPLENPDLYDRAAADEAHFDGCVTYRSLSVGARGERDVGLTSARFGAPSVAMLIEVLARRGVRSVIGVGYCGGLDGELRCGDLLLCTAAQGDTGIPSAHGRPPRANADVELVGKLERALAGSAGRGAVWSVDTLVSQTDEAVRRWIGDGFRGVDMESAALLSVAEAVGVAAATVLVVSDHPASGSSTDPAKLPAASAAAYVAALDCA
jgi:uridine phosphorylase